MNLFGCRQRRCIVLDLVFLVSPPIASFVVVCPELGCRIFLTSTSLVA